MNAVSVVTVSLRINNRYSGDRLVETRVDSVVIPVPPGRREIANYDDWLCNHIFPLTGTGHEIGDAYYDVEVTQSDRPDVVPVGTRYEFGY